MQLAGELRVSRSVTREAIKILSALGRVRAHRGRGLFVADDPGLLGTAARSDETPSFLPTNLDHVIMLFEFRRIQEIELSRLAAQRATPAELRAIGDAVQLCRDGVKRDDEEMFVAGDNAFHLTVGSAAHNPFLLQALQLARRLQRQSAIIGLRGHAGPRIAVAAEEHAAIYRAIHDGDAEAAAAATAVHIDNSLADYQKAIQRRLFG
jgi:DNA-binding FadR family transcriptional regulator